VNRYMSSGQENDGHYLATDPSKAFREIIVCNVNGEARKSFAFDESVVICIRLGIAALELQNNGYVLGFRVKDQMERVVFTDMANLSDNTKIHFNEDGAIAEYTIPGSILVPNTYHILFGLHIPNQVVREILDDAVSFEIEETGSDFFQYKGADYGCVIIQGKWR